MTEKEREKAENTDNQATQYINLGQQNTTPVSGDTIVYKPLRKVESQSNQNYQRQNVNDYSNQNYQRQNVNDYSNQNYQRQNVNDYSNQNYQRQNVNDYSNQNYQRQNVNRKQTADDYANQNYHRQNYVDDYDESPQRKKNNSKPSAKNKSVPKKKKKKKHSMGCLGRIIRTLIIIFLIVFIIYSAIALFFIKKIEHDDTEPLTHYSSAISDSKVKNILIIGTDTRDTSEERGRSDSMILLSLNSRTNEIYLTSIMRDSYVEIEDYGWDKLTHAYSYGGANLLIETIEKNFSVRIDDYIAVNFNAFASIVDALDGIEVEVTDAEAEEINTILQAEVNELMGDAVDSDLLEKGGKLILNGKQALSYSRIRYVGNSDFERTERQREVLTQIIEKVKSFNPSAITSMMSSALPKLSTNMSTGELYILSLRLPFLLSYDLNQQRIPAEDTYYSTTTDDGGDALGIDFDENLQIIKNTIFK